jgi:hypothetical protein
MSNLDINPLIEAIRARCTTREAAVEVGSDHERQQP